MTQNASVEWHDVCYGLNRRGDSKMLAGETTPSGRGARTFLLSRTSANSRSTHTLDGLYRRSWKLHCPGDQSQGNRP